jgi:protein-tyrosine phosphatase
MIDLHCHLIPGVDDGPPHLAQALDMARMAVQDGVKTVVATPHINPKLYPNTKSTLQPQLAQLRHSLAEHGIELDVRLGAEIRVSEAVIDLLAQDELPFLGAVGSTRVLLLELPHSHVPVGSLALVKQLLAHNIRPLLAHPERNKALMDDVSRLEPFVAAGCWLQLTAGAVLGDFGRKAQHVAWQLLDDDAVRVVASDAHNTDSRPPGLKRCYDLLTQRWGEAVAQDLLVKHPQQIVAGQAAP